MLYLFVVIFGLLFFLFCLVIAKFTDLMLNICDKYKISDHVSFAITMTIPIVIIVLMFAWLYQYLGI